MKSDAILEICRWIADVSLAGATEDELLAGCCRRAIAAGLPLQRGMLGVDTLHPVLEGHAFKWSRGQEQADRMEMDQEQAAAAMDAWRRSPFHYLLQSGETRLRRRLDGAEVDPAFPVLADRAAEGATDYVAYVSRLAERITIGEMDCIYSAWSTDRPGGFNDDDLVALDHLVQCLAVSVRGSSAGRIAETLVETYLGLDAGRRVLRGSIRRGVPERIAAVLWFSDLRGFTRIVDTVDPELIIPMLNDYADAVVSAIHGHRGQVLKFIGDGLLAFFPAGDPAVASEDALAAATDALARIRALNEDRQAAALPTTGIYLALHAGEVFYGNVGAVDRLDFTVVGPAVNEASRIAALCRSVDREIVLSDAFAAAAVRSRNRLVSLGRYALRGVDRSCELFTLDPAILADGDGGV